MFVLIFYASFYPFSFDLGRVVRTLQGDPAHWLPWGHSSRGDRIGNLLFYLPLGALAAFVAPIRWNAWASWAGAVVGALALSLCVELLQHATRIRVPNRVDLAMNGTGAAIGAIAGALLRTRSWPFQAEILRHARPEPVALLLLALWIAFHALPFMPRLSWWKAWRALQPLRQGDLSVVWTFAFAAGYLVVGSAVRRLVTRDMYLRVFVLIAAASIAMRLIFTGQWLMLNELLGLAIAIPVALWLRNVPRPRAFRITAIAVAVVFAIELLYPTSSYWREAIIFLERAFMILGILWLCAHAGWSLIAATAVVALLVAVMKGMTLVPLVVLGAFLVHAGRVFHETMVSERGPARAP